MNKRYSEEERQRHLSACEKSGLSIMRHSKKSILIPGLISFWKRRQKSLSGGIFEQVVFLVASHEQLPLNYPTELKIHMDSATELSVIKALLHFLGLVHTKDFSFTTRLLIGVRVSGSFVA